MLGILVTSRQRGKKVSELVAELPARFTASDRLKEFPVEQSRAIIAKFTTGDEANDRREFEAAFGKVPGTIVDMDRTDGLRVTFANDEIIHLRPSGNAPEFRCYTEADTNERALEMNRAGLERLRVLASEL
jgi:phosphomannomutase